MIAKRSPLGSHEKSVTASESDGQISVQRLKAESIRTLQLNNFHREVFLADAENLEVAEDGLLRLCVPVDLDTQEISLVLPVQFTLRRVRKRVCC